MPIDMGMTTAPASVNGSASASGGPAAPASAPSGGSAQTGGAPAPGAPSSAGGQPSQPAGGGFMSRMASKVSGIIDRAGGSDAATHSPPQPKLVNEMEAQHDANRALQADDAQKQAAVQADGQAQPAHGTEPAKPVVSEETRAIQAKVAKLVAEGKMPGQAKPAAPQTNQPTQNQTATDKAAQAAVDAAKPPADPWAQFEADDDGAELFEAMGYDPKELDDKDPSVKAIRSHVTKQNQRFKALAAHAKGQFREVAEAIAPLMQLADKHQQHVAVAQHIQTQFAIDAIANSHPFYAQQLGIYAKGELADQASPLWTARETVTEQAMKLMESGIVPTFDAAVKYVVETTFADAVQKADNQQTPTAPPGTANVQMPKGGSFEERMRRRVG